MTKIIAFARERYPGEARCMVVPSEVPAYRAAGFDVWVETKTGAELGIADAEFADNGASVVSRDDVWRAAYVVKYKTPQPEDFRYFRSGLTLASSFHAEGEVEMVRLMCESGMTAYSLEYCVTPDHVVPLPRSDMEITGKLAFIQGAYLLQAHFGGSGVLLAHVPGADDPRVLVIGHGKVGGAAVRAAAAMGCAVTVLGRDRTRLREFAATVGPTVTCRLNSADVLEEELRKADLVMGAILIATEDTPPMIEKRHLAMMKKGSLLMDVTCGYGDGVGWMPTFHRTSSFDDPVYEVDGVLHYKMDRIPSRVPRTASQAKSRNVTPYLIELGDAIYAERENAFFTTGKIVEGGRITHPYLKESFAGAPGMASLI
ncbi:NAD(P)-dependent oxidoreductase [Actinophytocola algeriensis]|uniref:Alanine dehydrogenase n=1 Tax=Actinophytocola algeriensis TaxID=1768010 RepID=A0A7W7Q3F2_9PSEU|nr:NAD(P)-dependent oxidoreductase [Actinophytocola algeriensis]MBB4906202.1 alanine dehydrogenase [Actinophytocola algeriensis]MBE1472113.1 alanine dehydrogenase [Actinophytocola algeriensis]